MTVCGEGTLVNRGLNKIRAVTLKCKAWTCADCAVERRKQLIALIASGHPERLMTFTLAYRPGDDPLKHARFLISSYQKLMREVVRTGRCRDLQYACVIERHKSGYAHLHVAQRGGFIDRDYLVKRWRELTGSWNVDIRIIRNAKDCAAYIAKYMGKDPQRFGTCKRYWTTKAWDKSNWTGRDEPEGWSTCWEVRHVSLLWLQESWEAQGFNTVWDDGVLYGSRAPPSGG